MGCSKCSSTPCSCKSTFIGCSKCYCNPCKCVTAYYNTIDVCEEDNCQKIFIPQFYFGLCPQVSWNIPSCGFTAILSVPGVQNVPVGGWIWHEEFGFYQITSIDSERGLIGITNNCTAGNASPGTQVPACTCFVVTISPPDSLNPSAGKICVEFDFTAPAEGNCIDIIVNDTVGLMVPSTIQIGTGFYLLTEVKADNVITICNEGEGITPGTPVVAKDINGNFNFCLSIISSNPCDREETPGKLLVCDSDGVSAFLSGCGGAGYIPVTVDGDCNAQWTPQSCGENCTKLTAPLSIMNGVADYVLTVTASGGFVVGQLVLVSGRIERFKITNIPDGTTIEVTALTTPGDNQTIAIGAFVCLICCCEQIERCGTSEAIFAIVPALYSNTVDMGDVFPNQWETIPPMDDDIIEVTAPVDCPDGTIYHYKARMNVSILLDYDHAAAGAIPVISGEVQLYWFNNPLGGRFNWVDTEYDGFPTAMAYPLFTFFPVWSVLTLLAGNYPMTFHSGEVVAETVLFPGQSTFLILDAKLIQGEALPPTAVRTLNVYVVGEVYETIASVLTP